MKFRTQSVIMNFSQDVIYEWNAQDISLTLGDEVSRDAHLEASIVDYHAAEDELRFRIKVRNIGDSAIQLKALHYVRIKDWKDFQIGAGDSLKYQVYRQGRHKNDIPSIFTLGIMDERFADAAGGMQENGVRQEDEAGADVVHSDSMTMFHYQGENVLLGYLTGRDCFVDCAVRSGTSGDAVLCGCVSINVLLQPGREFLGEEMILCRGEDENTLLESFAGRKRERAGGKLRKLPKSVFCTWYYYGLTVTYEDVLTNLREIQKRRLPFEVYQIDEGWEITLGEWMPNQKFPVPMKQAADEIREAGLIPGIWTSPFIAHETASVWKKHPEWMLCDKSGIPYDFPMNDTVYQVMDITDPAVCDYYTELYHRLTFEWGYTYHKLDFTRAAILYEDADFYDKEITLPQAYYRAVAAIRKGMGDDAYFLMCGGLYDPIIGLVDGQRTSSDVLSMWVSNINRDGKALPFTIKQNLLRYYMNEWWSNDPDALMVRRQKEMSRGLRLTLGLLNEEEVKTTTANQYIGGGLVCSTEPLTEIDEDRLYQLKHVLPMVETKVRVKNLFEAERFPQAADVLVKEKGWHNYVLINWDDEKDIPAELVIPEEEGYTGTYLVSEFYSGQYREKVNPCEKVRFGMIKPHGCAVFKVERTDESIPHIVGSDAHYSMGGEIDILEMKDHKLFMKFYHYFDTKSTYQILIPKQLSGDMTKIVEIQAEGYGPKCIEMEL